jgi:hypothetical protein
MRKIVMLLSCVACVAPPIAVSPAAAQSNCVQLLGSQYMVNNCSRAVMVRWIDQGDCRTGCATDIGPEQRVLITQVDGMACWNVSWYPQDPGWPRC